MSANNPHSPTCILAGEITPLAMSLADKLTEISCTPYFIPLKITATNNNKINSNNTTSIDNLQTEKIARIKYIFYFAPESILENVAEYNQHFLSINKLLEYANLHQLKSVLIIRDIKEYTAINQPDSVYKISQSQISTHIQQLTLLLKSFDGGNGFKTRIVVKDLVGGEITRNSPLAINGLFMGLPQKIFTTKRDNHLLHPLDYQSASKQIIKTTFSQNYLEIPYEIIGDQQITLINAALFLKTYLESQTNSLSQIISIGNDENYQEGITQKIIIPTSQEPTVLLGESIKWCLNNPTQKKPFQSKLPKAPIYRQVVKLDQEENKKKITKPKKQFQFKLWKKRAQAPKETEVSKTKKINQLKTPSETKPILIGLLVIILVSFFLPPALFIYHLNKTQTSIESENFVSSLSHANKASKFFSFSSPAVNIFTFSSKIFFSHKHKDIQIWINIIKEASKVLEKSEKMYSDSGGVINQIITNQKGDVFTKIEDITINLETTYNQLSSIQANLSSIDEKSYKNNSSERIISLKNQLNSSRKSLMDVIKLLKNSPEILGKESSKTYLTLLQNNSELRPTGGFIGSFALITFESGKLLDIETFDVYSADGQLRGHVEPPAAIKKYLGEAGWYLRDSNWDPNFPVSARRAEWFLDKELNRQVDGTIGINLYVIKDLLAVTGEIEIPDYQETISADNLFHRAEYFSELNYFDGSTQKKDFLSSLINSLYFKISSPDESLGLKALWSIINSANKSQLQISLRNKIAESSLSDTSFSGAIKPISCGGEEDSCLSDYLSIIESNVGVNKVNYFVDRSINQEITLNDDSIDSQTEVTLTNKAETVAWPAGTYKNFIRFLIPPEASIKKVLVDGKPVKAADLEIITDNLKKSLGFLVEVPINSQKVISLNYSINRPTTQGNSFVYKFLFEKQSGTAGDPVNIQITSNSKDIPTKTTLGNIQGSVVNISTNNDLDRQVRINFTR